MFKDMSKRFFVSSYLAVEMVAVSGTERAVCDRAAVRLVDSPLSRLRISSVAAVN